MKPDKIIIKYDGTKGLYELVREQVIYELENDNKDYGKNEDCTGFIKGSGTGVVRR